ncbi:MAG: chemotaxis protein CheX [Planctomycetota bacterium]|jgi:CheY-specific phosphatase CheX
MIETTELLTEAFSQAAETMAFMSVMPIEDDMPKPQELIQSHIEFTGPSNGSVQILAGSDFATTLAENIAALDEVEDQTRADAMKELSNVTCGLLLPQIASSEQDVFDVTVPQVLTGDDAPKWDEFIEQTNTRVLNIEDHLVAVRLIN